MNDTPADYAVRVKNIPIFDDDLKAESTLKGIFEELGFNVCKVAVVYDVRNIVPLVRKIKSLKKRIRENNPGLFSSIQSLEKELEEEKENLN